jgi:hypothetical protein
MFLVQFLAGQIRRASLLSNCLAIACLDVLQKRLEDTGEMWKADLDQWSCQTYLGRQSGDIC